MRTPTERYWLKVLTRGPDECWSWIGAKSTQGYGIFWDGDRLVRAHRYGWQLANGPIPPGLVLDHTCHNGTGCFLRSDCPHRACQNPRHMEPVSQRENHMRGNSVHRVQQGQGPE